MKISVETQVHWEYLYPDAGQKVTHEMRHQYQSVNKSKSKKRSKLSGSVYDEWNETYYSYDPKDPNKNDYAAYYTQPVEEDAKAFVALSKDDDNICINYRNYNHDYLEYKKHVNRYLGRR